MHVNELLTRRMSELLSKDDSCEQAIMEQVNKEAQTKGTQLNILIDLYSSLMEAYDPKDFIRIGKKILKLVNDYEVSLSIKLFNVEDEEEQIRIIKETLEECKNNLKEEHNYILEENEDVYYHIPSREYVRILHRLGTLYLSMDRKKEAMKEFEKIIKLNPRDNLGIRLSLIPYYFEINSNKLDKMIKKIPDSIESIIFSLVKAIEENRDYKRKLNKLIEANRFVPLCFSGLYILSDELIEMSVASHYRDGSFEECANLIVAFSRVLEQESYDRMRGAFESIVEDIHNIIPFDEEEGSFLIGLLQISEMTGKIDFKINYLWKIIKGDSNVSNKVKGSLLYDSCRFEDKQELEDFLIKLEERDLIEMHEDYIHISRGGLALAHTLTIILENMEEDEERVFC